MTNSYKGENSVGRIERRQQRKLSKKLWTSLSSKGFLFKILSTAATLAVCCFFILNILIWTSDVSKLEEPAPQPTIIYDQKGKAASKISVSNIEGVSVKQIPKSMIHAVIATTLLQA